VLHGGVAQGPLVGGNLSLLAALCGTRWQLRTAGSILLLEDVREAPYRIDRMLVQLRQAGCLGGVAGIAFGYSPTCERAEEGRPSLTLREVLEDHLMPLGVPLVYGWPFGHTPPHQWTLPLGVLATLDAGAGTLTVLEPACAETPKAPGL
jgi:muramoyltetrapeptide carboxypeptidase